jgi:hypothetical protein
VPGVIVILSTAGKQVNNVFSNISNGLRKSLRTTRRSVGSPTD